VLPGVVDPLALGPNVFITTVGATLLSGKSIVVPIPGDGCIVTSLVTVAPSIL
jgi:hypothetical protein